MEIGDTYSSNIIDNIGNIGNIDKNKNKESKNSILIVIYMSEYLYPCASLYLNTQHIQLADGGTFNTNLNDLNISKGQFQCNGQVITFKQLNFHQILGSLYNEYDAFNLRLSSVNYCTGAVAQIQADFYGLWLLRFSGAQLLNQCYNHLLGVGTDQTPITVMKFDTYCR
ncbi:MAG: hypothetical protein EOO06_19025 [Chitinophagaceae bacterium]|nr:MAG: hypothetical protein EOO06_19025 [Chitinophagaceae bacterium]